MSVDQGRVEAAVAELLAAIGEDPTRPGLQRTPRRVAEAYAEYFAGLGVDPVAILRDGVDAAGDGERGDLVLLRGLEFRSMCEHHLLPFRGVAHVGYLPGGKVVGLGRLGTVVETLAARPQLQERLGEQIADALDAGLAPRGVIVVLDAQHDCVAARDARQTNSTTVTVASRGALSDPAARAEAMTLIGAAS
ncbi:GTP cyclohydrolase I [Pseudolysinimonas yzui]|uniref:GTP cyclohydrolase 1 n=1 Tax=Pseudolysinimonas yzui TaxID=2708254 RepID=A0A8J3GSY1_9MICO|nr:GTP cyclohydrolase I [Pseudolysinimonas yzui]GHF25081.1 GTP cyclohydrolase 1 [Pseudolysinimonas yzui]